MPTRRRILQAMAALPILSLGFPALAHPSAGEARLMVLVLRGGMDGLAAVPAPGDPAYAARRGALAVPKADVLDLDGTFGLHPGLSTLHALYGKGELAILHACCSPYRDRSHFAAQDMLENGMVPGRRAADGWLARALPYTESHAIAVGETVPLLLRGGKGAASWAPSAMPVIDEDTLRRIAMLYEADPLFAEALDSALGANAIASDAARRRPGPADRFRTLMGAAGRFLAAPEGPRVAVVELGGWDTHSDQRGRLDRQFGVLDQGIAALRDSAGTAWPAMAVLAVTEFGRTAAINGTGGTDHGTGGAAFLLGGAVRGGRVVADWPGLQSAALLDGRDLRPTTDLRAIIKGVLRDHLGVPRQALDTAVFPESGSVAPLSGLIRA